MTKPLAQVLLDRTAAECSPAPWVDAGPDSADPQRAIILPIRSATALIGFLVAGVSRFLALEHGYRDFFDLVAEKIST